jgi:type III pantothenate kinase
MLLAIDVGNTNIVFALANEGKLLHKWRISSKPSKTADEYMVWLTQLMALENIKPEVITGAIIATVVPECLFPLQRLCRRYFKTEAITVDANIKLGIKIKLPNPSEVGADRLVNAVAAHKKYGGPMVIIDFGTATTFDIINQQGDYCGGIICPGINLSVDALHAAAAALPRVAVEKPEKVIGTDTVSAIQSGIYFGYIAMVEGLVARIRDEFGCIDMKVIATGGLAPLFRDATIVIEFVDQELTIAGLFDIYELNRNS